MVDCAIIKSMTAQMYYTGGAATTSIELSDWTNYFIFPILFFIKHLTECYFVPVASKH